jgi:hypothetical protein
MKVFASRAYLALLIAGSFAVIGCAPPRDSSGRQPSDVVSLFVQAVNSNDFAAATLYWEDGSIEAIEFLSGTNFAAECRQRFLCSSYTTSRPTKQKMDFWSVEFHGGFPDKTNRYVFYLHKVAGEWKLHQSRGM